MAGSGPLNAADTPLGEKNPGYPQLYRRKDGSVYLRYDDGRVQEVTPATDMSAQGNINKNTTPLRIGGTPGGYVVRDESGKVWTRGLPGGSTAWTVASSSMDPNPDGGDMASAMQQAPTPTIPALPASTQQRLQTEKKAKDAASDPAWQQDSYAAYTAPPGSKIGDAAALAERYGFGNTPSASDPGNTGDGGGGGGGDTTAGDESFSGGNPWGVSQSMAAEILANPNALLQLWADSNGTNRYSGQTAAMANELDSAPVLSMLLGGSGDSLTAYNDRMNWTNQFMNDISRPGGAYITPGEISAAMMNLDESDPRYAGIFGDPQKIATDPSAWINEWATAVAASVPNDVLNGYVIWLQDQAAQYQIAVAQGTYNGTWTDWLRATGASPDVAFGSSR